MYRIYADHGGGDVREFGRDYTREEAEAIVKEYSRLFPGIRYRMRKV